MPKEKGYGDVGIASEELMGLDEIKVTANGENMELRPSSKLLLWILIRRLLVLCLRRLIAAR